MATVTQHAPGTFCWPELSTTDPEGAKRFYTSLFGWTFEDNDMGEGQYYTMLRLRGADVGALSKMQPEMMTQGVPPHWSSYVAVESADATAAKAKQLGGTVLMEPFDVMEHGRMAVLQDPTGATFCLWQPKRHTGVGVLDEPGSLCWTELMTQDTDKAGKFYAGLFPWRIEAMPMPGMSYTLFKRGAANAGGMMKIQPEMGPIPSHWLPYFAVADCDASVARAQGLGAKIEVPSTDVPEVGRFSVIRDPQGAYFGILGPEHKA